MTLTNWAYIHTFLPVVQPGTYRGFGGRLRRHAGQEKLSLHENQRRQWSALVKLLHHAYATSPFYRRRFDAAGVKPAAISSEADLQRIPALTRDDIRNYLAELRSRQYDQNDLTTAATGGTTDTPIPILRNRDSLREKAAVQWQFNRWAGFSPGDKVLYLWGARQDYSEHPSWRWRLYDRYFMRRAWAPTSLFNESVLESYRQTLNSFRPRIIFAYPTPLALFCEFLETCGSPYYRPASAICTAEPLLASQRQIIEKVLGCPVFEHYGSREFGMIAAECERHRGLHLDTSAAYVERLPMPGTVVEGLHEILVTDLLNYGMPLIRYRINDCALTGREECECGRGYPLLKQITGRTTDVFYLRNGDVVPGISLQSRVIQVCPGLKKIQVVQETVDCFRVRFVPGAVFKATDLSTLRENLRRFFPDNAVRWEFEEVADIERERSGKTRFCISQVVKPMSQASSVGPRC